MASKTRHVDPVAKILRGLACSAAVLGPYIYTIAQPEKTLKYRFIRPTDENGKYLKVDSSYNRLATEIAYRMKLPEQMRRSPKFDIRSTVHSGLDFNISGHFTPVFDGVVYIMVPQWANISSLEDLKKVKIDYAGQQIDFSRLNFSMLDTSQLKFPMKNVVKEDEVKVEQIPVKSKSWFGSVPPPPTPVAPPPPPPPEITPLTREQLLVQRLINTFHLSDEAKKYVIADQFEIASGPWHMIAWCIVAGSFFLPFSLYTRLRTRYQTRLKRFLFFHFLLFNGLVCFYLSPFFARLINMQVSRIRDSSSTSYGLDILEGGIEFLEKQLERNRILRELLPHGKNLFDADGERRKTRIEIPNTGGLAISLHHWNPVLAYRLKRLKAKMDYLMSLPEDEAKRTILKKPTENYWTR